MKLKETHKYDDIIRLSRPVSKRHPPMSLQNRAAQFSPFAALTGHGAAIRETARLTEDFAEPSEDQKARLDEQLQFIREHLFCHPEIEAVCFQPDERKSGGAYVIIRGRVKKIDEYRHQICLLDGNTVDMERVVELNAAVLPE